jgi:hypothetical protein
MDSPFPGVDPYLEQSWGDVHHGLVTYAHDTLQQQLPRDLRARIGERVFVEGLGDYGVLYPAVRIVEQPAAVESGVAIEEPLVTHFDDEPISQGYIEIVEVSPGNRVVTVIEFLSPSNKTAGAGQDLYLRKQREVLDAKASLVESDLTREGRRVMAVPPERIPPSYRTTYQACVCRGWKPLRAEVYRAALSARLPVIRIPLRETDADVPLDLQLLVDQCYRNGRYDDINYKADPVPPLSPLSPPDAAWADPWLRSKGLR